MWIVGKVTMRGGRRHTGDDKDKRLGGVCSDADREIREARGSIGVLQTEWAHVAGPARIQELAQSHGMTDTVSAQLSSFDLLPRRGDAPLNNSPVRNASAQVPQSSAAIMRPTLSPQPISDLSGF